MRRGYICAFPVIAALALSAPFPAGAAEGPFGIGFVQAEEGTVPIRLMQTATTYRVGPSAGI